MFLECRLFSVRSKTHIGRFFEVRTCGDLDGKRRQCAANIDGDVHGLGTIIQTEGRWEEEKWGVTANPHQSQPRTRYCFVRNAPIKFSNAFLSRENQTRINKSLPTCRTCATNLSMKTDELKGLVVTNHSENKLRTGGCHCGAVRYEVTMNLERTVSCNCSICTKAGFLLAFVPANQFKLLSDEEALRDYQFNKKIAHHVFCSTCGIHSFSHGNSPDGQDMRVINLRCLDELDLESLTPQKIDGRKW
jgi:hypothetical protein